MKTRNQRFQLLTFHEVSSRIIVVLLFVCAFAMSGAENALAVVSPDLTPWLNPAGANNNGSPPPYDIETCANPTEGVPCDVMVTITNRGSGDATAEVDSPIEIRLRALEGGLDVTQALPEGTTIGIGSSIVVTFSGDWVPQLSQATLEVEVDPNSFFTEPNESNNVTTRPVVVGEANEVPVIYCEFESPGDKWLAVLPVLVDVRLTDGDGNAVGRQDLPDSADGTINNPVATVSCGAKTDENTLIFIPGPRRHPVNIWTRLLYPGRNAPAGTCSVDVYSGDEDAYTLDPDSCHTEYESVKIFGHH